MDCPGETGILPIRVGQSCSDVAKTVVEQCEDCTNGGGCWCKNGCKDGATNCANKCDKPPPYVGSECKGGTGIICSATACTETNLLGEYPTSDYQPETGRISFADGDNGEDGDGGEGGDIGGVVLAIGTIVGMWFLAEALMKKMKLSPQDREGADVDLEEEESEILKSMKNGFYWGFMTCVVPRIVGELGGWIAEEGSTAEGIFKISSAIGKGMANVCNVLTQLAPVVMMFIQFYISYLRFEMCMEMVEMQIDTGAQVAAQAGEGIYQTRATAQTSINVMNSMMDCFNQLMEAMNRLTMTSIYMSSALGSIGGVTTKVTYLVDGRVLHDRDHVCGKKKVEVEAQGYCKGGAPRTVIRITGEGGNCEAKSEHEKCVYTMPTLPTYSGGGYYGGYYGAYQQQYRTGDVVILDNYYLDRMCEGESTITIEVEGVKKKTLIFYYHKNENDEACRD